MRIIFGVVLFFASQLQAVELMFYYSSHCVYSRKVLRYLDSINKTLPMKDIYRDPEAKKEFFEIVGEKIVPCLTINGKPLYDANEIIEWLSSHPENLLPKKAA